MKQFFNLFSNYLESKIKYAILILAVLFIVPASVNAQQIGTGVSYHSIAIKADGAVYTWGENETGQLGIGYVPATYSNIPVAVYASGILSGKTITTVSAGENHSLALASDGTVYSWGYNYYGGLGDGTNISRNVPVAVFTSGVLSGKTITEIAAGGMFSIALASDGSVYTWGLNQYGELGDGTNINRNAPVAVSTSDVLSGKTIIAVSAGNLHSIALASDGTVYTWGFNTYGQLGNGTNKHSNVPVAVSTSGVLSGKTIIAVAAATYHSVALASDGTVYAWGYNIGGQLGNGTNTDSNVPVAVYTSGVLSGKIITAIATGFSHSIALASDGTVYGWGYDQYGQLGNGMDGYDLSFNTPQAVYTSGVLSGKTITDIAAGAYHSMVLDSDGTLYTWGENSRGVLGNGTNTRSNVPVIIWGFSPPPLDTPTLISPGSSILNPGLPTNFPINLDLEWNNVTGAIIYRVQVTVLADTTFSSPIIDTWAGYGETSYSLTNLDFWTNYLWRVYAYNPTTLQQSDWSETNIFMTKLAPPILISPPDSAVGISVNPILTWHRSPGAMNYGYEIYSDSGCTNLVVSGSTLVGPEDSVAVIASTLDNLSSFYWRVMATHPVSSSDFSEVRKFTTIEKAQPYLSWPIGGTQLYSPNVSFSWYMNGYFGGLTYDLLYSTDSNMSNPTIIPDITSTNYTTTGLLGGIKYYWRVRTKLNGVISAYSGIESFITNAANQAQTPIPSWPVGNVTVYSTSPTLYWYISGPGSGLTYEVELSTGELTGTPTYTGITSSNFSLSGLSAGTSYNWHVRSTNGTEYSDWSSTQIFTTYGVTAQPVTPIISWPIGGAIVYTTSPTLYWYLTGNSAGLTYEIEYSTGILTGVPTVSGIGDMHFTLNGLQNNTVYNWQVRSTDGSSYSNWSTVGSFSIAGGAGLPGVPIPSWPIGGATVYSTTQTLSWYLNSNSTGLEYEVLYSNSPDEFGGILQVNTTALPWSPGQQAALTSLTPGATYYWQVRSRVASSPSLVSNYSTIASFVVASGAAPVVPIPGSPIANVTIQDETATLSWLLPTLPGSALVYEVEFADNQEMKNSQTIKDLANTYVGMNNLLPDKEYYWRVRSHTSQGAYSNFSNTGKFNTNENITSAENDKEIPTEFMLCQNYPNPFNPSTSIEYALPVNSSVEIRIFDITGKLVMEFINNNQSAGYHNVIWDSRNNEGTKVASGVYIYNFKAYSLNGDKNFIKSGKMMLLK